MTDVWRFKYLFIFSHINKKILWNATTTKHLSSHFFPSLHYTNLAFAPSLMHKVVLIFSINLLAGALPSTLPRIAGAFFQPLARQPNATRRLSLSLTQPAHIRMFRVWCTDRRTEWQTDTEVYTSAEEGTLPLGLVTMLFLVLLVWGCAGEGNTEVPS